MKMLSIVIPVYNEAQTIRSLLAKVRQVKLPKNMTKQLVIVDDFSTDGTRKILEQENGAKDTKIVFHDRNKGKGAALHSGFAHATGDWVIVQDADMEYDPNEYAILLEPVLSGNADVVYGSRFLTSRPHRILYYWHTWGNKVLTWISNMFSDLNLTDMETCYKLFRRDIIQNMKLQEERFGFEPEVTAHIGELVRSGKIRLYEVGISYYGRTYDEGKKIGWRDGFRALWCIFKYNNSWFAKIVKYTTGGILVASSQLLALYLLVEYGRFSKIGEQNIANLISIECSIIIGYLIHANYTWSGIESQSRGTLRRLASFHMVTFVSVAIRAVFFYALSLYGTDYKLNAFIGIAAAIFLNFFGYDRIVFRKDR